MLRKIRIAVALLLLSVITFGFVDFNGTLPHLVLQKFQLVPALLALSLGIVLVLVVLTVCFGRIYCSTLCPLGVFQDMVNWVSRKLNRKKKYGFRKEHRILRFSVLVVSVGLFLASWGWIVEPYSLYGRIATQLFAPLYALGNNFFTWVATSLGSELFYRTEVLITSMATFSIALASFAIVVVLSAGWGRTYCTAFCPVGTLLGYLSKKPLFHLHIDTDRCNGCGLCGKKCKAYCIDTKNHRIDTTRCVDCFDCIDNCKQKAISLRFLPTKEQKVGTASTSAEQKKEQPDASRRQFLKTATATAVVLPLASKIMGNEPLATLVGHAEATAPVPMSPPGSVSHRHLTDHCTACHLCITQCPSHVLKPATLEYGWDGLLRPMMVFDKGYCAPGCTQCSDVCPNGAIRPITVDEKRTLQPGHPVLNLHACRVVEAEHSCGACSRRCPVDAIELVDYKEGLQTPKLHTELCIGCGRCAYTCPGHAIHMEGNSTHLTLTQPEY